MQILAMLLAVWMTAADTQPSTRVLELPEWNESMTGREVSWKLGSKARQVRIWGEQLSGEGVYFEEFLPALFVRTLVLDECDWADGELEWMFTGPHAGFTLRIRPDHLVVAQRFYDSYALNEFEGHQVKPGRHPEKAWFHDEVSFTGRLESIRVLLTHNLKLHVYLNGYSVVEQVCLFDVDRHQLQFRRDKGSLVGRMFIPGTKTVEVRVERDQRHQRMLGFGGIVTPTAYRQLSEQGKRRWWELLCEYNLLIQREYPNGTRLNREMDNYDNIDDASPHYYGDNFPNGEISDFGYMRTLRRLGGQVWYEMWALPHWATMTYTDVEGKVWPEAADPERYAEAMVNYCRASAEKAGAPPEIVGVQNEIAQPPAIWYRMVEILRTELDAAGFGDTKIHMSDAGYLKWSIDWAKSYLQSPETWTTVDYAAAHAYDYQLYFHRPDGYDPLLKEWRALTGDKPFLLSEVCINRPLYQHPSYRIALVMGELYHKTLVISDASAVSFCWMLINIVQPSYGWSRTLFVVDRQGGFVPASKNNHLRVYGSYSRRIKRDMQRVSVCCDDDDLLVSAFVDRRNKLTVVLLNRGVSVRQARIAGADGFAGMEVTDPYRANRILPAPRPDDQGAYAVEIEPGAIVTLFNVELNRVPEGFEMD